jgi:hypothetical protein
MLLVAVTMPWVVLASLRGPCRSLPRLRRLLETGSLPKGTPSGSMLRKLRRKTLRVDPAQLIISALIMRRLMPSELLTHVLRPSLMFETMLGTAGTM